MTKSSYNIKEIRQLYNLTQQEFALALGLTREMVNKMEKGRTGISRATSALITQFLQERKSENYSQNSDEVEFYGVPARKTPPVPYHLQRREQKNEPAPFLVPLVGIKAQAGYVKGYEQVDYMESLEQYSLPPGVNPTGAIWRYFEVDGDSMEPTLLAGDIILASMLPHEDWNEIRNQSVYVLLTDEQLLVKRVCRNTANEWILISDNEEAYPPVPIDVSRIRQVWMFRRHIRSRLPNPKEFKNTA